MPLARGLSHPHSFRPLSYYILRYLRTFWISVRLVVDNLIRDSLLVRTIQWIRTCFQPYHQMIIEASSIFSWRYSRDGDERRGPYLFDALWVFMSFRVLFRNEDISRNSWETEELGHRECRYSAKHSRFLKIFPMDLAFLFRNKMETWLLQALEIVWNRIMPCHIAPKSQLSDKKTKTQECDAFRISLLLF
jgi:hypothetical protein